MNIVFDLDGTLADCTHRVPLIPNWEKFFAACPMDTPIAQGARLLRSLSADKNNDVRIWTGRPERVRQLTEDWLYEWCKIVPAMKMRADGDRRDDYLVKAEYLLDGWTPDLVFEDRTQVVDMWRARGISCYQVAKGDF